MPGSLEEIIKRARPYSHVMCPLTTHHLVLLCLQGSVEERIMEMVQQRKEGPHSQQASTSRGLTWADLGLARDNDSVRDFSLLNYAHDQY